MRLYYAGVFSSAYHPGGSAYGRLDELARSDIDAQRDVLESYFYWNRKDQMDRVRRTGRRLFLDSGAYSAWNSGKSIDLHKFCRFIHDNADAIEFVSVLDVIGDAGATYANQVAMERAGVRALPCFHKGEPGNACDYYASKYEHITIGGMVGTNRSVLIRWLDEIWDRYLTDGAGNPKLRVHGFGLTDAEVMYRYPWYSVDSATWILAAKNGHILRRDGRQFSVSVQSNEQKRDRAGHLTLSPMEHQVLSDEIATNGYTLEKLETCHYTRSCYNARVMMQLHQRSDRMPAFRKVQQGLFA